MLSGLLTGLGALWLLLMAGQFSSGGVLDDAPFWVAFAVAMLVAGLALLVPVARRGRGSRASREE